MSTVAKVFVVLNLLLAVAFLGSAATLLGHEDAWKAKLELERRDFSTTLAEKERNIADLNTEKNKLSQQKNEASARADAANAQASAYKTSYEQVVQENNKLSAANEAVSRALGVAQSTIQQGRTLVDHLQEERTQLVNKLQVAEEAANNAVKMQNKLELDMEGATTTIQDLNAKLASAQSELERANFRIAAAVNAGGGVPAEGQPAQRGKVLQADNEHNIFVISLGSEDGVKVGFKYTVSRGRNYVATFTVTRTEAKMSAGTVELSKDKVMQGDDVMNAR
jgi:hypothetical protein